MRKFTLVFLIYNLLALNLFAQDAIVAEDLMNKAFAKLEEESFAITYDDIAYDCKQPLDIFTLPTYKIVKGGYLFCNKDKFELKQGHIKGISDGNIYALINEEDMSIVLDSIRDYESLNKEKFDFSSQVNELVGFDLKGISFKYIGTEKIKGKDYYKIKSTPIGTEGLHSIYYISKDNKKLFMYADFNGISYDVFKIKSIGDVPPKHQYTLDIPQKRLTKFHGFKVMDLRFVTDINKLK